MKRCSKCDVIKGEAEFYKNSIRKDSLRCQCKACDSIRGAAYRAAKAAYDAVYSAAEGYGVYIVTYPSGLYIGSGSIMDRRSSHLKGNCDIARTLDEQALSFKILLICEKSLCLFYEQRALDVYGMDNLLNKHRAIAL